VLTYHCHKFLELVRKRHFSVRIYFCSSYVRIECKTHTFIRAGLLYHLLSPAVRLEQQSRLRQPLKGAVWTGGPLKEGIQVRGRILSLIGSVSISSDVGISGQ
jgi:hypothetical protein